MNDAVVIAAFRLRDEAVVAAAFLRHEGIAAEVHGYRETVERRCDGAFPAGFDLLSAAADAERAIALLQSAFGDDEGAAMHVFARCPACRSLEVTRLRRLVVFVVTALVLLAGGALTGERDLFLLMIGIIGALLLLARPNRCRSCGERFRGRRQPVAPESAQEAPERPCPRCGSLETERLVRRREKALTLLVNMLVPPLLFVWPFLPRRRCTACQHQWR